MLPMADVTVRGNSTSCSSNSSWHRDVLVQTTTTLTTTGGTVWGAAHRGITFFEATQESIGLSRPGVKILELGAGCGLMGLTLARNLPLAGEVCLTEQAYGGALDHLRVNVERNREAGMPGIGVVTTAACDWSQLQGDGGYGCCAGNIAVSAPGVTVAGAERVAGAESCGGDVRLYKCNQQPRMGQQQHQEQEQQHQEQQQDGAQPLESAASTAVAPAACSSSSDTADLARLLSSRWDLIVGSDLVYNEAGTHMLPRVMRALALTGRSNRFKPTHSLQEPSPEVPVDAATIYYAHTKHRYDICDVTFMEQCREVGLRVEEVWEPGVPPPPPSPPPFTELFPEMRAAVFKITVA